MSDITINIGRSILQHGNYNDRIYLMKLSKDDCPSIIDRLEKLALDEKYSKIIAKIPAFARDDFVKDGYIVEASIPGFYNGVEDVYFVAKYLHNSKKHGEKSKLNKKVLGAARSKSCKGETVELPDGFRYKMCGKLDIPEIVDVYKKIFETYPFPVYDPRYIEKTMDENVIYFGIWKDDMIAALASSEMDIESKNVEMTDFATLPQYRGNALSAHLLQKMECEMQKKNMKTTYTIARAGSYGMNITFAKSGYMYSGTLLNNTNIFGNFESMNVWYKHL